MTTTIASIIKAPMESTAGKATTVTNIAKTLMAAIAGGTAMEISIVSRATMSAVIRAKTTLKLYVCPLAMRRATSTLPITVQCAKRQFA